jgi:Transglycosylase
MPADTLALHAPPLQSDLPHTHPHQHPLPPSPAAAATTMSTARSPVAHAWRRLAIAFGATLALVVLCAAVVAGMLWAALRPAAGEWQHRLQWRGLTMTVSVPALLRLATHPLTRPLLDGRTVDTPLGRWQWRSGIDADTGNGNGNGDRAGTGSGSGTGPHADNRQGITPSGATAGSAGQANADTAPLHGRCAPCRLQLAGLGAAPLVIDEARLVLHRSGAQRLHGTLWLGAGNAVALEWQATLGAQEAMLALNLPPTEAAALLRAFAASVPEARVARVEGRVALRVRAESPSPQRAQARWTIEPQVEGLAVRGLGTEALAGAQVPGRCRAPVEGRAADRTGGGVDGSVGGGVGGGAGAGGGVGGGVGRRADRDDPARGSGPIEGWLPRAVIAAEDQRFWEHPGYDLAQLRAAWLHNQAGATAAGRPHGASTITQQLAKLLVTGGERSPARKLRELLWAIEMERTLGKGRILQLYLALAPWGEGTCGAAQAARAHLGRDAHTLGPVGAAWLASLLTHPDAQLRALRAGTPPDPARLTQILSGLRPMSRAAREKALDQARRWQPPAMGRTMSRAGADGRVPEVGAPSP